MTAMQFAFASSVPLVRTTSARPKQACAKRKCRTFKARAEVLVVGAGVIGLTTAIRLREAGHDVEIVALETPTTALSSHGDRETKAHYTSSGSGGYWMPFSATGEHLERWCLHTLEVLRAEAEAGVPGVTMHEGFILHYESMPDALPFYADATNMVRVTSQEDGRVPPSYACGLKFNAPICRMDDYLPHLERCAKEAGIELRQVDEPFDIELARYAARDEFGASHVLVNCTGIGARKFSGDEAVTAGRGVTVRVRKPKDAPNHFITESPDDGLLTRNGLLAYCLPRGDEYTLGGTLFEDNWETTATRREADELVARCATLIPGVDRWERTKVWSGLRPLRRGGMCVDVGDPIDGVHVVNNYGHGGSGVTACWGCANDVVDFVNAM